MVGVICSVLTEVCRLLCLFVSVCVNIVSSVFLVLVCCQSQFHMAVLYLALALSWRTHTQTHTWTHTQIVSNTKCPLRIVVCLLSCQLTLLSAFSTAFYLDLIPVSIFTHLELQHPLLYVLCYVILNYLTLNLIMRSI